MKRVKVDLQCPYCGFCKIFKIAQHRKAITCPSCNQSIFLSWATGIEGVLDNHGCYFHAYEPFNIRKINQEFKNVFGDTPPKSSFTIRKKIRG
ncbi:MULTISPECIES: hypothetical protein [Streptococcus]|uniref:Phage protein n=1 Tax=Streptococcus equi subsp. zooepidemicus Sz4is TaxID=1381082 RepID=A0AAW3GMK6_STRSZ|nr:hypothetical protein [Streptococcus dysgalactiae]KIS17995.1 hypothetical protein AT55_00044 [Streptococcus equi subsp. zooepidemicus Sz4is]HEP2841403.1 hypothetical protein [Streptococcus pyogenes]